MENHRDYLDDRDAMHRYPGAARILDGNARLASLRLFRTHFDCDAIGRHLAPTHRKRLG